MTSKQVNTAKKITLVEETKQRQMWAIAQLLPHSQTLAIFGLPPHASKKKEGHLER